MLAGMALGLVVARGHDPALHQPSNSHCGSYRYTPAQHEYFYLLIALDAAFTFLIFPAPRPSARPIPWYDIILFALTFGAAIWLMLNIRKQHCRAGNRRRPQNVIEPAS